MKRNAPDCPKMLMLQAFLKEPRYAAVGILECLWHWTARYAPDGGVGKYTDEIIAQGIGWTEDAGMLIQGLVETGWIDARPDCRLYVHDWHVHSDSHVDQYLSTSRLTYANGEKPRNKPDKRGRHVGDREGVTPKKWAARPTDRPRAGGGPLAEMGRALPEARSLMPEAGDVTPPAGGPEGGDSEGLELGSGGERLVGLAREFRECHPACEAVGEMAAVEGIRMGLAENPEADVRGAIRAFGVQWAGAWPPAPLKEFAKYLRFRGRPGAGGGRNETGPAEATAKPAARYVRLAKRVEVAG